MTDSTDSPDCLPIVPSVSGFFYFLVFSYHVVDYDAANQVVTLTHVTD